MRSNQQQQRGAALITALLVLAICASLATFLLIEQRLLIHQSILVKNSDNMQSSLQNVEDWALSVVQQTPLLDLHKVKDYKNQLNGITLSGKIMALGGRFNINSLQQTANNAHFVALLHAVNPQLQIEEAQIIVMAINAWMQGGTRQNDYYQSLQPPYRAAQQTLFDISELRLIRGIMPSLYSQLVLGQQTLVTALPNSLFQINVNYMTLPVLMSLGNIDLSKAQAVISCRDRSGFFKTVGDFVQQCGRGLTLPTQLLTTENPYYLIQGLARIGEQQLAMTSLIKTVMINNHLSAQILWQVEHAN